MSNILFKTAYNINYDKVVFDGTSISIGQLKKLINEKLQKSSKKIDFDLEITNADTNTVYQNDNETILKNSRVNVKRTLKNSTAPLRSQPPKPVNHTPVAPAVPVATVPTPPAPTPVVTQHVQPVIQSNPQPTVTVPVQQPVAPVITKPVVPTVTKPVYDSLAPLNIPSKPIVYVEETVKPVEINNDMSRMDEKAKLETILMNSMTKIVPDQNLTNKFLGINSRFLGVKPQINPADRPIPPGYICNTCRKPGHLRQFCPENGILPKPEERPKFPSGIPRSNLRPAQAGDKFAKLGPEGYVVTDMEREASKIIKKDKVLFDDDEDDVKKVEKKELDDQNDHIPKELQCPYGGHLIKDAVLVPCCGHFVCCDECIKQKIVNEEQIICPNKDCNQEIESLVSLTPFHEIRNKVKDYLKNSKAHNESKDPFFDLILENVNNQELSSNLLINKLSPNGPKSPVQDSKISSSEKLLAEQQQQQLQVSLNGGTNLNSPKKTDENKAELSPGQILPVQNSNFVPIPQPAQPTQFQPRPVRPNFNHGFNNYRPNIVPLTNNYPAPRPMMPMNNFNPMYRPHFQQQFDPMGVPMGMPMGPMGGPMSGPMVPPVNPGYMPPGMMNGPMNPMYQQQPMMPGMIPQNQPQMQGIMSKEEYYEYQEKLKKEAEIKLKSYKRSRSKSRGRYSRSRSRSLGRYKSSRYRKSRSRSRNRSRDRNYKRHSRSRSRSRRRTRSKSRDRSKRDSKARSSRDRKMNKREDTKLKVIEEHKIETKKSKEKISDEPVDKKKKLDEDVSERKVREVSVESSASERESGKESSGSKKHKKHKKSKKKHKRRSTSKH
ncbi:unnamed protein product [Brachionus calyciflorus]|uniref:DWNN domain-containing protein n=1 Tax=Brachionus calyciflorus TaxID=104777 RepID=A0A813M6S1_9BILA|nr:unnamed protein product [Brachionus calyciflorus]